MIKSPLLPPVERLAACGSQLSKLLDHCARMIGCLTRSYTLPVSVRGAKVQLLFLNSEPLRRAIWGSKVPVGLDMKPDLQWHSSSISPLAQSSSPSSRMLFPKNSKSSCMQISDIRVCFFPDPDLCQRSEGWDGERGGRRGSGWGTHVRPWLIHVNVW